MRIRKNSPASVEALRRKLAKKAAELRQQALKPDGDIDIGAQVAELAQLRDLLTLSRELEPPVPRRRWPMIVILACSIIIIVVLAVLRVPETRIEIEAAVSGLEFDLLSERPSQLTQRARLRELALSAACTNLKLPRAVDEKRQPLPDRTMDADSQGECRLNLALVHGKVGSIEMDPLLGLPGSKVTIRHQGADRRLDIDWETAETLRAPISLRGWVEAPTKTADGITLAPLLHERPRAIRSELAGQQSWTVVPAEARNLPFALPLAVSALSFEQASPATVDPSAALHKSTILSGSLKVADLRGLTYLLHEGEELSLQPAGQRSLFITALTVDEGVLKVRVEGDVNRVHSKLERPVNHLPTYLTWTYSNPKLGLLWSAAMFIFGLLIGVAKWMYGDL